MIRSTKWTASKKESSSSLTLSFDKDDELVDKLTDIVSEMGKSLSCYQVAGREGLTIIVRDVSFEEISLIYTRLEE